MRKTRLGILASLPSAAAILGVALVTAGCDGAEMSAGDKSAVAQNSSNAVNEIPTKAGAGPGAKDGACAALQGNKDAAMTCSPATDDASRSKDPTVGITANGQQRLIEVLTGTSVEIKWTSANVTSCLVRPFNSAELSGTQVIEKATETATYVIDCMAGDVGVNARVEVRVKDAPTPIVDLTVNGENGPVSVPHGTPVTVAWASANVDTCTVTPGDWTGTTGEQESEPLAESVTFKVACDGPLGPTLDAVTVNVDPPLQVTADIKARGVDGPITVAYGDTVDLTWTSANAASCALVPAVGTGTNGSVTTAALTASQIYELTCTGPAGGSVKDSVVVNVSPAPPVEVDVKANGKDGPIKIALGEPVVVSWTSKWAKSCKLTPSDLDGTERSVQIADLQKTTTYSVTCDGIAGGTATDEVIVNVVPMPTATLTANGSAGPVTVFSGDKAALAWSSTDADTCELAPLGLTALSGTAETGALTADATYTLTCKNISGTATKSVTITVLPRPTARITADGKTGSISVAYGASATIAWTGTDADSCSVTPGSGTGLTGSLSTGALTSDVTYTLTCKKASLTVTDAVTVKVVPKPTAKLTLDGVAGDVTVAYGATVKVEWSSQYADGCSLTPSGHTELSGSLTTSALSASVTYTLSCSNVSGTATATATIKVVPLPTATITANGKDGSTTVLYHSDVVLDWSSTDADSCKLDATAVGTAGQKIVKDAKATVTYTLTCTNVSGSATDTVEVRVQRDPVTDTFAGNVYTTTGKVNVVMLIHTGGTISGELANSIRPNLKSFVDALAAKFPNGGFHLWIIVDTTVFTLPSDINASYVTVVNYGVNSQNMLPTILAFFDKSTTLNNPVPYDTAASNQIIVVSDKDATGTTDAEFVTAVAARSSMAGKTTMNGFYAVPGTSPSTPASWCRSPQSGTTYQSLVKNTALGGFEGYAAHVCEPDWSTMVSDLAKSIIRIESQAAFKLSKTRDTTASLAVTIDGVAVPSDDYAYDAVANAIVFDKGKTPANGSTVVVTYYEL